MKRIKRALTFTDDQFGKLWRLVEIGRASCRERV